MKIHQVPHGASFRFQGEEYVKTGPMMGSGKDGQKMFPRYADLELLSPPPVAAPKRAEMLRREAVLQAFETFYAECRDLVADEQVAALDGARQRFLKACD